MVNIQEIPEDSVPSDEITSNANADDDDDDAVIVDDDDDDVVVDDNDDNGADKADSGTGITEDGWQKLMGNDLIMKVIGKKEPMSIPGQGNDVKPQDAVLVDFVGRIAADNSVTDGPIFQQIKGWLVVVGDGDILPALEMAIRFMEAGQTALVWAHSKYAMGPGTRTYEGTTVPPHSNVMYEVTVSQKVMDTSRLNPYFTIQKALTKKNIANDIYQYEYCPPPKSPTDPDPAPAMSRAIRLYQKAAKDMETLLNGTYFNQVEKDHPQRGQTQQILLDSLNNIVAVYLRQKEYHKAKQSAVEVLKQDPKNLKGLLRAAKSSLLDPASTLEEVKAALDAAESEITYKNPKEEKELKRLRAEFKKNQSEYKKRTKAMFQDKLKNTTLGGSDTNDDANTKTDEAQNEKNETTMDDETKTRDAPETQQAESNTGDSTKDDEDDATFWKKQLFTTVLQIVVPLVMFFIYRIMTKADKIARGTLVGQQEVMMEQEAAAVDDSGLLDGADSDETINLDL